MPLDTWNRASASRSRSSGLTVTIWPSSTTDLGFSGRIERFASTVSGIFLNMDIMDYTLIIYSTSIYEIE